MEKDINDGLLSLILIIVGMQMVLVQSKFKSVACLLKINNVDVILNTNFKIGSTHTA